jgi:hypothetical protein
MLAWMSLQQAKALWGRGDRGEGGAMALRQVAELETLGVKPWAEHAERTRWVRIVAEEITGRRLG